MNKELVEKVARKLAEQTLTDESLAECWVWDWVKENKFEKEYLDKAAQIIPIIAEEISFEILEWFREYARQLDRKHPNPTTEEQGWLGNIWDMIRMAGKEEWKSGKR